MFKHNEETKEEKKRRKQEKKEKKKLQNHILLEVTIFETIKA
jgi:hypothetical protein